MPSRLAGQSGTTAYLSRATSSLAIAAAAFGAVWGAAALVSASVEAKTPGKTYCFVGKCHRVMTLDETRRAVGQTTSVVASHYGPAGQDRFNPSNVTSSGEMYRPGAADNAASPKLPNGTVVLVRNPATQQSVVLRINNAGPYWGNRTLDVSRGAAQRLGFAGKGVANLQMRVLRAPSPSEASYQRGRRYAAVPGPIGSHGSLEQAAAVASRSLGGRSIDVPASTTVATKSTTAARTRTASVRTPAVPAIVTPAASAQIASVATVASSPRRVVRTARAEVSSGPQPQPPTSRISQQSSFGDGMSIGTSRTARRPAAAETGSRVRECQGWVGSCTVSGWSSSSLSSGSRVASSNR